MTQRLEVEPSLDAETEYRAIEAALLETERGRWFLAEHGRRSRRSETREIEDALLRLKSSLRDPPALLERVKSELAEIGLLIANAREQVLAREPEQAAGSGQGGPGQGGPGQGEPRPTVALLETAASLHELVWSLQAREIDADVCERVGRQAAAIQALSMRQAAESRRALRHAETLDTIAARLIEAIDAIDQDVDVEAVPHLPASLMAG